MATKIETPDSSTKIHKKMSYRVPLMVAAGEVSACLVLWLGWGIHIYWNDPRLVNFLAAWIPFVLSTLLAFVPEHQMTTTKKWCWRASVMTVGLSWSVILWHQQVVADRESERAQRTIVDQAVTKSNQHADEYLGALRGDLTKKIEGMEGSIGSQLGQTINQSTERINDGIGKFGKPEPPEKAKIVFSLWPFNEDSSANTVTSIEADKDGVVPVSFTLKNTSGTTASNMDIWLGICRTCEFVGEPEGFDKPAGMPDEGRHRTIALLNPQTILAKSTVRVKNNTLNAPGFTMTFRYSCQACADNKDQVVTIYVSKPR